jgi:hypothetical protein
MLFIDHKTKLVYPLFQEEKAGEEACRSKYDYETFVKCYKIDIEKYHMDNGAFRMAIFHKEIDIKGQKLIFRGVNSQWQNGLVEGANGT